jgi:hypothetical protein
MLGNASLRGDFRVGPSNDAIARAYLEWLRNTRRRTALTVYQYAAKIQSFLSWVRTCALPDVATQEIESWLNRPRSGTATTLRVTGSTRIRLPCSTRRRRGTSIPVLRLTISGRRCGAQRSGHPSTPRGTLHQS